MLLWSLGLVLPGVRTLNRWTCGRSLTALALAVVFVALAVALRQILKF